MIKFRQKGDFSKLDKYFSNAKKVQKAFNRGLFDKYARMGLADLA